MNRKPLRYKISSWDEVRHIQSNNSPKLKLQTADIVGPDLRGLVIRVNHDDYGCLFSTLINARGPLLNQQSSAYELLTIDDILLELSRFGFEIIYAPEENLDGEQLNYLMNVQTLGYDKLRLLPVKSTTFIKTSKLDLKLVAFKSTEMMKWMDNLYQASSDEFLKALEMGSALNLTESEQFQDFDWSFLRDTQIMAIEDILRNNS